MGRILVADDHDALRRGLARGLAEAGHEVEEASNGNAAIERLHEGSFDIVLSDLKMGGSDGLDVLRTTRALHPTTAVILMTAFGSVKTAVEAMKLGASDYINKPFDIEELQLMIEKAQAAYDPQREVRYLRSEVDIRVRSDRWVECPLQRVLEDRAGGEYQDHGIDYRRERHGQGNDRRTLHFNSLRRAKAS